jgi:hypothetical protein
VGGCRVSKRDEERCENPPHSRQRVNAHTHGDAIKRGYLLQFMETLRGGALKRVYPSKSSSHVIFPTPTLARGCEFVIEAVP